MLDVIMIVNKHQAFLIFTNKPIVSISSDRDVRELIYLMFDIHLRLVNDDITQKIDLQELEKVS